MPTVNINQAGRTAIASFTRPNDILAYAAGDTMSDSTTVPTVLTFPAFGPNPGGFCIIDQLVVIDSANQATKPDLELWLFDTPPPAQIDNAAYAPTDAQLANPAGDGGCIGVIPIPLAAWRIGNATVGDGGNCVADIDNISMPINSRTTSSGSLYAVVVVRNAYTPVANERLTFKMKLLD